MTRHGSDVGGLVLAVVPARGTSRGLPGKHLLRIGGEPLIAHTIRAGLDAARVDHVLVSTDAPAIRAAAIANGAEAPFLRPPELSGDATPTAPVIVHAVEWFERAAGRSVATVVTLQATSPLRTAAEIDAAIALLDDEAVDSAVSVATTGLPASVLGLIGSGRWRPIVSPNGDARRQSAPAVHRLTGGIYVTRRNVLTVDRILGDSPAALVVDAISAIDVDTIDDLRAARAAWRRAR